MKLQGKTAIVTGAGRGIGRGCALELAKEGARVMVNDRPGSPDLEQTVASIRDLGGEVIGIEADVFSREGCESLVQQVIDQVGALDILVSNPAFSRRATFLEYDPVIFDKTIQGTLTSGFHMSQLIARHRVAKGGGGKIIFISSVQAHNPYQNSVAYNAAKAGLNHMARSISVELAPHRINVNIIEPGWIDTEGERVIFSEELIQEQGPLLPWGRLGTPKDIGRAVVFLASDDADYVTGTILRVDGGFVHKDC